MNRSEILISPPGYDNVGVVLKRLGGQFANGRQLNDRDMANLANSGSLSGIKHFFLNCTSTLGSVAKDSVACAAIRDFVFGGGTLYASDWASDVVSAAFAGQVKYRPREGTAGVIPAKISDPYLAKRLNAVIHLNFDASGWVRISHFPPASDVYITDSGHRPLAIGFRVGKGRVVFTSFHHHAQLAGPEPSDEDAILEWLVTLPVQHRLTLVTRQVQARHRASVQNQVVGRMTGGRQVIPMKMPAGSGLGVISLSWDRNEQMEVSMRYLRDREIPLAEERSARPPLVMTIRNPGRRDSVEIGRRATGTADIALDEPMPFAFAAGVRRDLLENPDWLASAFLRHVSAVIGPNATLVDARERLTTDRVLDIAGVVLSGLGFRTDQGKREIRAPRLIRAWPLAGADQEMPALEVEAVVTTDVRDQPGMNLEIRQPQGKINPGIERLLVSVSFVAGRTDFSWEDDAAEPESPTLVTSSSGEMTLRLVADDSAPLGHEGELMSDQEFHQNYHVNVQVFRVEPVESASAGENSGDDDDQLPR